MGRNRLIAAALAVLCASGCGTGESPPSGKAASAEAPRRVPRRAPDRPVVRIAPPKSDAEEMAAMRRISSAEHARMLKRGVPEAQVDAEGRASEALAALKPETRGLVVRLVSCREGRSGERIRESIGAKPARIAEAVAMGPGLRQAAEACERGA